MWPEGEPRTMPWRLCVQRTPTQVSPVYRLEWYVLARSHAGKEPVATVRCAAGLVGCRLLAVWSAPTAWLLTVCLQSVVVYSSVWLKDESSGDL